MTCVYGFGVVFYALCLLTGGVEEKKLDEKLIGAAIYTIGLTASYISGESKSSTDRVIPVAREAMDRDQ